MQAEDLHYVGTLIDESKQAHEIFLDYNVEVPMMPEPEVNWKYGLKDCDHSVRICRHTARPVSVEEDKSWQERAREAFGFSSNKELFKGCKYIEEFIMKYRKRPTADELAIFYYNRYVEAGKRGTLPHQTGAWVPQLLKSYGPVFSEGHDIKKIVAALKESRNVDRRVELELQ